MGFEINLKFYKNNTFNIFLQNNLHHFISLNVLDNIKIY